MYYVCSVYVGSVCVWYVCESVYVMRVVCVYVSVCVVHV